MKNYFKTSAAILAAGLFIISGCQKMERPALGNYPKDNFVPGGPLKFYAAYDGGTDNRAMNAVDSIQGTFPADNQLTFDNGINGKCLKGENKKFVNYAKPNDWALYAKSFSISFWYKRDGQTKNNAGTNGPEYIFSFKSSYGHWSGANTFLLLEGNNSACAVKLMMVDKNMNDKWFVWEGGNSIPGLLDNQWHHLVLVYDAATSQLRLYKDGVVNPVISTWTSHGNINLNDGHISEFRVGAGPGTNYNTDDWLSSTWKGLIDQLRFYSSALTASEVSTLYNGKL